MCYACLMSSAQSDVLPPGVDGEATVRQARSSSAVSLLKVLRPGRYFNALAVEVVETETTFLKPLNSLSLVGTWRATGITWRPSRATRGTVAQGNVLQGFSQMRSWRSWCLLWCCAITTRRRRWWAATGLLAIADDASVASKLGSSAASASDSKETTRRARQRHRRARRR